MGTSTNAYLYYGLDVMDEYNDIIPPALRKQYDSKEVVEKLEKIAKKHGLELDSHCHSEYPVYYLHAKQYFACRGYPERITDLGINTLKDTRLRMAAKELGIEDADSKIDWWLASYWG